MKPLEEIDPELFIYELYDSSGLMSLEGGNLQNIQLGIVMLAGFMFAPGLGCMH